MKRNGNTSPVQDWKNSIVKITFLHKVLDRFNAVAIALFNTYSIYNTF